MAKTIASISDGRVVPWYSDEPVPAGYVEVPDKLLAKFASGKIADGVALAKLSLAGEANAPAAPEAAPAPTPAEPAEPTPAEPTAPFGNSIPTTGRTRA